MKASEQCGITYVPSTKEGIERSLSALEKRMSSLLTNSV